LLSGEKISPGSFGLWSEDFCKEGGKQGTWAALKRRVSVQERRYEIGRGGEGKDEGLGRGEGDH